MSGKQNFGRDFSLAVIALSQSYPDFAIRCGSRARLGRLDFIGDTESTDY